LDVLARGSLSFSFAGWFLPEDRRVDAARLYSFCRHVDDLADEAPDPAAARSALDELAAQLRGERPRREMAAAMEDLFARRGVDRGAALCLIEAVASDLELVRVADDRQLLRYAYGVAGTVGLMMCGVLGVTDPVARRHAIDLGVAMQLTNICRDVAQDAGMDRVYLPADRLAAAGCGGSPAEVLASREAVQRVVTDVLGLAERYYTSADHGLRFIPARARLAICVAARVYRAIGLRLMRFGGDALAGRTVVPGWEKVGWMVAATFVWVRAPWWTEPHAASLHGALDGLPGVSNGS
jgi:phytoene synthase